MRRSFPKLGAMACLVALFAFAPAQKMVVAYLLNWNDVHPLLETVDFSRITHLNIAFENPTDDAGDLSFNEVDTEVIAKAHEKNIKVLVSIGGGGASEDKALTARYFDLQSDSKRAAFIVKLAGYLNQHNFDGLDVDLEGPSIGKDYGAFITDLSKVLIPSGKLLTSAVSQGYGGEKIPNGVFDEFSFVNVMAYDGTGPWDPKRPGQHSSLDYAKGNVAYWEKRGLVKSKIVLGVPFYGYGFGNAYRKGDYGYSEIVKTFPGSENLDQVGNTIWYNGIPTMRAKAKYVVDEGLAGIMIWSLSSDVVGDKSLLKALSDGLNPKG